MSLSRRFGVLVVLAAFLFACGGSSKKSAGEGEPTTAREKQLRDAKARGELDENSHRWGTWSYSGNRADCFYVLGRRCFKTKKAACRAARCKHGTTCKAKGGGPATVSCKKK